MNFGMEELIALSVGLGLAAACGFRVFVPLLVMSVAGYTGYLELSGGFEWVGTLPALIAFATATALEIAAYYVPWVDNVLDSISAPAAVVAGTVVTASSLADVDPFLKWSLAIIGGGGVAGIVSGATTMIRGTSTLTTGGLANPIFATLELVTSFVLSVLALVLPFVAVGVVLLTLFFVSKRLFRRKEPRQAV
jgi:hypothetical protein